MWKTFHGADWKYIIENYGALEEVRQAFEELHINKNNTLEHFLVTPSDIPVTFGDSFVTLGVHIVTSGGTSVTFGDKP